MSEARTPSFPLVNRGPEALQAVLRGDDAAAVEQLRLLTRSELEDLADAARRLADLVHSVQAQTWPARYDTEPANQKEIN